MLDINGIKFDYTEEDNSIILSNMYIADIWKSSGISQKYANEQYSFYNQNGTVSSSYFIQLTADGQKEEFEDYEAVRIKTSNNVFISFLLPKDGHNLKDIFTTDNISSVLNCTFQDAEHDIGIQASYINNVYIPEFSIKTSIDVNEYLKENYSIVDEILNLKSKQVNKFNFTEYGINVDYIEESLLEEIKSGDLFGEIKYTEYVIDRPFIFLVSYNDFLVYSGMVNEI